MKRKIALVAVLFCAVGLVSGLVLAQVEVKEQVTEKVPEDPLAYINKTGAATGLLTYVVPLRVDGPPQQQPSDIVIRALGSATIEGKSLRIYRATPPLADLVFGPQFSHNGRFILFKAGWPYERYGTYRLYYWDLISRKLHEGPKEALTYRKVYWSADDQYLAFIRGGDYEGNEPDDKHLLQLCIYDVKKKSSRLVAQDPLTTSLAWTSKAKLLYAASLPGKLQSKSKSDALRCGIYETSASEKASTLVLSNVFAPSPVFLPSPNDKWIAFIGWSNAKDATADKLSAKPTTQPTLNLYLFNRATKSQTVIEAFSTPRPLALRWLPDNQRLVIMETDYRRDGTGANVGEAHLKVFNILTSTVRELATLQAHDIEPVNRSKVEPQFEILDATNENIFIRSSEAVARGDTFYTMINSLQAIDTSSGKSSLLSSIKSEGRIGMDWIAQPSAEATHGG